MRTTVCALFVLNNSTELQFKLIFVVMVMLFTTPGYTHAGKVSPIY